MAPDFDVIIVGSGPAGATAAYFLGEAGTRVLVLEKETLPRYKTCGGGLSIDFLKRQFPFSFDPVLEVDVNAFCYAFDGRLVTIPIQNGVVGMVMRDKFGAYVLAHARAEVRQDANVHQIVEYYDRVMVETKDGRQFTGRYLIGADGANSVVARSLGLRRKKTLAAAIEAEVRVAPDILRSLGDRPVFIFEEIRLGYLWIFPKADHLSVGIAALHPKRGELQNTLAQVMERFGISLEGAFLHGHPIPIYTIRQPISTARSLLVGDAAGLVDPLSGEGIRYAIKSGRLAAEAILSRHPERYSQTVFRKIGINHIFTLGFAQFFYQFQPICLALGAPNPTATQAIVDSLSDRARTVDIAFRAFLSLPYFLLINGLHKVGGMIGAARNKGT